MDQDPRIGFTDDDNNLFPLPSTITCANCCYNSTADDYLYFNLSDDHDQQVQKKVNKTKREFYTVFELGIELKQIKSKSKLHDVDSDHEEDEVDFRMCMECSNSLTTLCNSYLQFMRLTKQASAIRRMIAESRPWETQQDIAHPPETCTAPKVVDDDDKGEVDNEIIIKSEIDKEDGLVPFHSNYFTDLQNELETPPPLINILNKSETPIVLVKKLTPEEIESEIKIRKSASKSKSRSSKKNKSILFNANGKYSCSTGTKSFPTQLQLKYHESSSIHKQQQKYPAKRIIKKKKKSLPTNSSSTNKVQSRQRIREFHAGQIIYNCTDCTVSFPNGYQLRRHRQSSHPSTLRSNYPCTQCPSVFFKESKLAFHLVIAHNIGPRLPDRTCRICSQYFRIPSDMTSHYQRAHSDVGKFSCPWPNCRTSPATQPRLNHHIKLVHEASSLGSNMCEHCGNTYKTPYVLKIHLKLIHSESPPQFNSSVCSKVCNTKKGIQSHMEKCYNESRVRNIACDQCPKLFYCQKDLKMHKGNVHAGLGPKPWACDICGARFAQKVGLRHHHLGSHDESHGPFPCPICGKEFKVKDYLKQHLNTKVHGGAGKQQLKRQHSNLNQLKDNIIVENQIGNQLQQEFHQL